MGYRDHIIQRHQQIIPGASIKQLNDLVEDILSFELKVKEKERDEYAAWIGSNEWIFYAGSWILDSPIGGNDPDRTHEEMYAQYLKEKAIWEKHQTK